MTQSVTPGAEDYLCAERNERCERRVEQDGDYCTEHDFNEPDYDSIRKERIIDERE
jgi:hypothetical protein